MVGNAVCAVTENAGDAKTSVRLEDSVLAYLVTERDREAHVTLIEAPLRSRFAAIHPAALFAAAKNCRLPESI